MMKTKRRSKLVLADLEKRLVKYENRIQKIAEMAYEVRKIIDALRAVEESKQAKVVEEAKIIEGGQDAASTTR